jgi:hypothetical protein
MATTLPPAPVTKPEPVSVTDVPPADVPDAGLTLVSEGGGATGAVTGGVEKAGSVLAPPQAESTSKRAAVADRRRGAVCFTGIS